MKAALFCCALGLPLLAPAQRLVATLPPITYHVGLTKAPLYSGLDTLRQPSLLLPSQSEVVVVGRFSPRWVVVKREGFMYVTPVSKLSDYDAGDAAPLPIDADTQLITYQGVVPVAGVSQADLYARAAAWAARTGNSVRVLRPQSRFFATPPTVTSESAILTRWNGQLYTVLGQPDGSGRWQVRLWWKPFVTLIWAGGGMIALGGLLALVGRWWRTRRQRRAWN